MSVTIHHVSTCEECGRRLEFVGTPDEFRAAAAQPDWRRCKGDAADECRMMVAELECHLRDLDDGMEITP